MNNRFAILVFALLVGATACSGTDDAGDDGDGTGGDGADNTRSAEQLCVQACERFDSCDPSNKNTCDSDCAEANDEIAIFGGDCPSAYEDFIDCLVVLECNQLTDNPEVHCATPLGTYETECSCCKPNNPCGWNDDGLCDCGGQFDWDAADCS